MNDENWTILKAENPEKGTCLYTIRKDAREVCSKFPVLVTIEWEYSEMDENQFPAGEERKLIFEFDELLDSLDHNETRCAKVMAITGFGSREWSFYTTSFESWINDFNTLMKDEPIVPISISHSEDQNMEYWYSFAKHISE